MVRKRSSISIFKRSVSMQTSALKWHSRRNLPLESTDIRKCLGFKTPFLATLKELGKDVPYKAALQVMIAQHPDLLEKIALAQLRAAAGLSQSQDSNSQGKRPWVNSRPQRPKVSCLLNAGVPIASFF
jgi:hypothetical protein